MRSEDGASFDDAHGLLITYGCSVFKDAGWDNGEH